MEFNELMEAERIKREEEENQFGSTIKRGFKSAVKFFKRL
jgi:hypothetical protein